MNKIRQIYFFTGIATLIHFAITGTLMRTNYFAVDQTDLAGRMMFRSNHIYILLCGLLNLSLHFTLRSSQQRNGFLFIAFALITAATAGLSISFYIDPISHSLERSLTRFSIIGLFAGTVLHLLCLQFSRNRTKTQNK